MKRPIEQVERELVSALRNIASEAVMSRPPNSKYHAEVAARLIHEMIERFIDNGKQG